MSTVSSDSVAQDQLRAFIERIERMEEEKKAISDDIKEIYAEAKGNGFDTKVLRQIIRIRKQDHAERMEQEALLELYMAALGMAVAPRDDDEDGEVDRPADPPRTAASRINAELTVSAAVENFRRTVDELGSTVTIEAPGQEAITFEPRRPARPLHATVPSVSARAIRADELIASAVRTRQPAQVSFDFEGE